MRGAVQSAAVRRDEERLFLGEVSLETRVESLAATTDSRPKSDYTPAGGEKPETRQRAAGGFKV